jgi:putative transposase
MDTPPVATDQKKARDLQAPLIFSDESGLLLAPLIRTTQSPRGRTPLLIHRASHRQKVSAAAALSLSPIRGHIQLHYQTLVNAYFNSERYALFLRELLHDMRGPLVLVHDNANLHRGEPMRDLCHEFPRLHLHNLPPYAPELNPVESLWNWCKDKQLVNFAPHDIEELWAGAKLCLEDVQHDQDRLRSFLESTPLSWKGTGLI